MTLLTRHDPRSIWAARATLAALVLLTFGRLLAYGPVEWDDPGTIFANPRLRAVSADTLAEAWTAPQMDIYMPVTHTAWALLAAVAGRDGPAGHAIDAMPFRAFGLGLHLVAALAVFELLRRQVPRTAGALLGASIFAVHPIQTEAVAWISGEKDLLAGCLAMLALLAATRAADDATDGAHRRHVGWSYATMALGTLAMLAKPQAVVVPLLIVVLLRTRGVPWRRTFGLAGPLLLPAAALAVVARTAQPALIVPDVPWYLRPVVALDAIGWYAAKLAWPWPFAIDYGHTSRVIFASRATVAFVAIAALCAGVAWRARRPNPSAAAGAALAVAALLPVLGLTKFEFQYYSTVADHYVYTAMFGVALAVAAVHDRVRARGLRLASFAIVPVLAVLAWRQAGVWRDTDVLMAHNLSVNPTALGPSRILAFHAANRGDDAMAVQLLTDALRVYSRDPMANYNLANAQARLGQADAAAAAFEAAIGARPREASFRYNYAVLLIRLGRWDEAERQLRRAVESELNEPTARAALARLLAIRAGAAATRPAP